MDELEREAKENFSFVGSDIMEVTKQLADIQVRGPVTTGSVCRTDYFF